MQQKVLGFLISTKHLLRYYAMNVTVSTMARRVYEINTITVNDIFITKVIIDSHYENKHSSSINDGLILKLVQKLNGRFEIPDSTTWDYLVTRG